MVVRGRIRMDSALTRAVVLGGDRGLLQLLDLLVRHILPDYPAAGSDGGDELFCGRVLGHQDQCRGAARQGFP